MSDTSPTPEPAATPAPATVPPGQTALVAPEFEPVYANLLRSFSDLPPAPPGGNWTLGPP